MSSLILEPTAQATWHRLVSEAAINAGQTLDESRESYLVFLLMRYLQRPDIVRTVLALSFLRGMQQQGRVRQDKMQDVGDQCLIYAGLFPEQANRRRVKLDYFISLGRSAYSCVAENTTRGCAALYHELADTFVGLADVLSAIRADENCPLTLAEHYAATGSQYAKNQLARYTHATLVVNTSSKAH